MTNDPRLDFSFSGLKTALLYAVRELGEDGARERRADLAASFQAAVVDQLVTKLRRAARGGSRRRRSAADAWSAVALGGGVAANSLLRERVAELCEAEGLALKLVAPRALHRQRGDDRLGRALPRADRLSRTTWAGTPDGVSVVRSTAGPDCHLCDEARAAILELRRGIELREVDIESDERLLARAARADPGGRGRRPRSSASSSSTATRFRAALHTVSP